MIVQQSTRTKGVALIGSLAAAAVALLVGAAPAPAAFPGANGKLAFISDRDGSYDVFVMNADGSGQTNVTNDPADDQQQSWSPDGRKIAFASNRTGNYEIFVMDADGSGSTNVTADPAGDFAPSWSPDGNKIAFTSNRAAGDFEVYVMNADGSDPVRLTDSAGFDTEPVWSPAGDAIAFRSHRDGDAEIYRMGADGSGETRLTTDAAFDFQPDWSPDGGRIAFTSDRGGNYDVYLMNADGSGQASLTVNAATDQDPAWSSDGSRIAFSSRRDGNYELYAVNADGTGPVDRLTTDAGVDAGPDWQTVPSADLGVALAASPNSAQNNKPLVYTITVSNNGPSAATGVVVTDVLPTQTRFVSVASSKGSCTGPPMDSTGTIVCDLGTLAKGEAPATQITVKVIARKTAVTNTATVTSSTSDPNPANDSASVTSPVK